MKIRRLKKRICRAKYELRRNRRRQREDPGNPWVTMRTLPLVGGVAVLRWQLALIRSACALRRLGNAMQGLAGLGTCEPCEERDECSSES